MKLVSKKTVIFGLLQAMIILLISYIFRLSVAIYLLGVFCILKGIMIYFVPDKVNELDKTINKDRWSAFAKKDKDFKNHVKKNLVGYIIIGLAILYIGYRFSYFNSENTPFQYYFAMPLFVLINFFGETISVIKSKNVDQYRKYNIYVTLVLVVVAMIFI